MGKKERANKYSNDRTQIFPFQPPARSTHAKLKKMFVVSHIKKCGTKRKYDPGATVTTATPKIKKIE